ncbi:MAG: hypothetical protein ACRED5_01480, partial [Propylenella sp.]
MSRQSRQANRLDAIRSVSLEDIVMGRHTRWRRFLRRAKPVLLGVSILGLTAAMGSAFYYGANGSGEFFPSERQWGGQVELASEPPAPLHTGSVAASAAAETPPAPLPAGPKIVAAEGAAASEEPVAPQLASIGEATHEAAPAGEPADLARVPNPRPDEPVITGSIPPKTLSMPRVNARH